MTPEQIRNDAMGVFSAGLRAVEARELVAHGLQTDGQWLQVAGHRFRLFPETRLHVVGAGKAVAGMAQALENMSHLPPLQGVVLTKYGHELPLKTLRILSAGHPIPDAQGQAGVTAILHALSDLKPEDLVLVLLTGGASALMADPVAGLTLSELGDLTQLLLRSGATIDEVNSVRKHLSVLKGGQLLLRAQPARVLTLVISDVIGNPLDVIASGPTVPDPSTYADALYVLEKHGVTDELAPTAWQHLRKGAKGEVAETWKGTTAELNSHACVVLGQNGVMIEAAAQEARSRGYGVVMLGNDWQGPVEDVAQRLLTEIRNCAQRPACLLAAGEVTVRVTGNGLGGRAQHLALMLQALREPHEQWSFMAVGTDGTDGPTDAAGALVTPHSWAKASAMGLSPHDHLARHDSYAFFSAVGGHVITGPTGTNVMDLYMAIIPSKIR